MKRKRVLIIGAGAFQVPLIQYSSRLCDVLVAAPVIPEEIKPFLSDSLQVDVRDFKRILSFAQGDNKSRLSVDGVLTDQTDIAVCTVAKVAESMHLPGIDSQTAQLFTNKSLMRKRIRELGLQILPYETVYSLSEAKAFFKNYGGPVIIKPADTQGSRGVQKCNSLEELVSRYSESSKWASDESDHAVIIERCALGREFVVEGLAINHEFWNLCIGDTQYFKTIPSFSAKERSFPTFADNELRDRVLELNHRIITGFGLKQGITHSEFIMDNDEIYLLETAARGGGAFISSDLVPLCCGIQTEDLLLKLALGELNNAADIPQLKNYKHKTGRHKLAQSPIHHCAYLAFYIPQGKVLAIRGVEDVLALPYVSRTQLNNIHKLIGTTIDRQHTDKTTRYLVTLVANNHEQLEERMAHIRNTIEMDILTPEGETVGLIWE